MEKKRTGIFTYTDLRNEKYVKGIPFTEDKVQIVTPVAEDQPTFHESKKVRIYLEEMNGEFSIVCAMMGVEEI